MTLRATRLSNAPLIDAGSHPSLGENINGPSVIRMPEWAPGLGRYHMYFAHHRGRHIRLAFADRPEGPWTVHPPGALEVGASGFVAEDLTPGTVEGTGFAAAGGGDWLYAHVASPDVHVDHEGRRILMYFHGLLPDGDQRTRLAVSRDGLSFVPLAPLLGPPYFRVFSHGSAVYALSWGAELWRATRWEGPFERGPQLFGQRLSFSGWQGFRHGAVHVSGDRLTVLFTRIGDRPERVLVTEADLRGDWTGWRAGPDVDLLRPARAWEGAELARTVSRAGAADAPEHALRDPDVFVDADGAAYLFYVGAGEQAIGGARLEGL